MKEKNDTMSKYLINKASYSINSQRLDEAVKREDNDMIKIFLKVENKLNSEQVYLQRKLGIYVPDPCVINYGGYCRECTGYFKPIIRKNKVSAKYKKCTSKDKDAIRCNIKTW
jgi:hypothetical protein